MELTDLKFESLVTCESLFYCNHAGQSMNISNIDVRSMLPENLNHFFRYQGSLTTPPCYESILWTVFDTPITLSHNQVQQTGRQCRTLEIKKAVKMVNREIVWCITSFSSSLLCSDQETGEYSDGYLQQNPME